MSNSHPAPAVVVGVDGSNAATHAALWAIDEAVSRDIPMRLVYVIDPRDASTARACEARLAAARTALADAHRNTVDEMYRGPAADRAKVQAARIAWAMHRRLTGLDAPELLATVAP